MPFSTKRAVALALTVLIVGSSTASAAPLAGTQAERSKTVTTPFTTPGGAPIVGTKFADGRVVIESVNAKGAGGSAVFPDKGPIVAKKGFWGKVWGAIKKAARWVKDHVIIK